MYNGVKFRQSTHIRTYFFIVMVFVLTFNKRFLWVLNVECTNTLYNSTRALLLITRHKQELCYWLMITLQPNWMLNILRGVCYLLVITHHAIFLVADYAFLLKFLLYVDNSTRLESLNIRQWIHSIWPFNMYSYIHWLYIHTRILINLHI